MCKNFVKSIVIRYGVFLFLFYFTFCVAQSVNICRFNGLIPDPNQWEENEFSLLLVEDKNAPGYFIMTRAVGAIASTDNSILKSSSCEISKYLDKLLQFYDKNKIAIKKKHENIADLLDHIQSNLNTNEFGEGGHDENT